MKWEEGGDTLGVPVLISSGTNCYPDIHLLQQPDFQRPKKAFLDVPATPF